LFGIYGASGFGREAMPVARRMLAREFGAREHSLVFVDDNPVSKTVNSQRVLTYREFLGEAAAEKKISIAIADSKLRRALAEKCSADGLSHFSVFAENAFIGDDVVIGEGCIAQPFVTFTSNVRVGVGFHANIYSYIAHDCVIGDYVTFAPGVMCNGNVTVEDQAYVGTGVVLRNGSPGNPLVIGAGAIVGMGAVVTKNVAPGTTVIGNPARALVK
jgi:sugar O-acyltransferase (sialic acid O-acetyltransferase NeuD family)